MDRINLSGFAEACYDNNSMAELIVALTSVADPADLHEWSLSAEQHHAAIKLALAAHLENCDEPEQLVGEWANTMADDVRIDAVGDIHDGRKWLGAEQLAEFYGWLAAR